METILVHTENKEQSKVVKAFMKALKVKFETQKKKKYNPEFVQKILEGDDDVKNGRINKITLDEIWK